MTKDEALKLALEALKTIDEAMPFPVAKLAQAAIKEALAQPWVSLTKEEINSALSKYASWYDFAAHLENILKEKNQ